MFAIVSLTTETVARHSLGSFGYGYRFSQHIEPGQRLDTTACVRLAQGFGGTCSASLNALGESATADGRPVETEVRITEGPWGSGLKPDEYRLVEGRWPQQPGEVVVGPDLAGSRVVESWGGRARFDVVGVSQSVFSRGGSFLLAAPGTYSLLSGADLEMSGVSASVTIFLDDPKAVDLAKVAEALGVDPNGAMTSRSTVVRAAHEWRGQVAILLPGIALAAAGGVVAGLAFGPWSGRVGRSLYRVGVARRLSSRWVRGAQVSALLVSVPAGLLVGWGLAWASKPLIEWVTGSVQSSPAVPWWAAASIAGAVLFGVLAVPGERIARASDRSVPRTVAAAAAVLGISSGPVLGLDQVRAELVGGALLGLSLGLVVPDILMLASRRSRPTLAGELTRLVFRGMLPSLGRRLGVVVLALGLSGSVVASLASSNLATNRRYSEGRGTPEHAVVAYTFDARIARQVPEWAAKSSARAHPIWFIGGSAGADIAVVQDAQGAAAALGREMTSMELDALARGSILATRVPVEVREGPKPITIPGVVLSNPGGYVGRTAGVVMRASLLQKGVELPTLPQHTLLAGSGNYVERIQGTAVQLGIGMTWYSIPSVPELYTGGLVDQVQPWILAVLCVAVMTSLGATIAQQVRPHRSALRVMGIVGWRDCRLVLQPLGVAVLTVVFLGLVPPVVVLVRSAVGGADVIIPWVPLLRNAAIVTIASAVGGVVGSWRVDSRERFQ
ncbi:hypothetical protein ACPCGZ_05745 [Propionibacteriaceae bacterium G1746]